ncbi:MAG: DUF2285 domain-containing protein [Rhizomicrobium sp.]
MGKAKHHLPHIEDEAPWSDRLTEYDRAHLELYVRLLDAIAAHADQEAIALELFGIDAAKEPHRAERVIESHLTRARWMTQYGFRDLLR